MQRIPRLPISTSVIFGSAVVLARVCTSELCSVSVVIFKSGVVSDLVSTLNPMPNTKVNKLSVWVKTLQPIVY